jgi:hypothetical protein
VFNLTVIVVELPPATVDGLAVTLVATMGRIVNGAVNVVPFTVAEIVAAVDVETCVVFTPNVPEVLPAAIVIDAGTVAALGLAPKVTTVPPGPAWPLRVTVPVTLLPPTTLDNESVRERIAAGVTVN